MSTPGSKLTVGTDYYVEGGRWVFTAAFHLRRGHCCGSGCRHCPYGNSPADHANPADDPARRPSEERSCPPS